MEHLHDEYRIKKTAALLVRLEPSLKLELQRRSQQEGISESAIVRAAIREFIAPLEMLPAPPKKAKTRRGR